MAQRIPQGGETRDAGPTVRALPRAPTPGDALLRTKLYAPPPRPDLVPRPRLEARLDAGLRGKLTLLAAPAGFGKTTLVGAWRATPPGSEVPLAWVSLDAGDSDPARFWAYVAAALETVSAGLGESALAALQSPRPPPIEVVLTGLLNGLADLPGDLVLVLDDYQVIEAPPIHQALAYLLDYLPPRAHLLIASRADPPLPLARLRAQGELTELRTADLRFTADEAAAFLTEVRGLPLAAQDVAALGERTEGWIAGLQLAALSLHGHGVEQSAQLIAAFTGSTRYVADYLVEEVLARQPEGLQAFLLQTAVLDRLCASLCTAVIHAPVDPAQAQDDDEPARGAVDSQAALEALERGNLFLLPLDEERRWYRYHHLFAELLRHRLRRTRPDLPPALHRRASAWCESAGLLDEAVRHALAAPDAELAAALVERHAQAMLHRSEVLVVRAWLGQLPEAAIITRPRLTLDRGWTLALTGDFAGVEGLLAGAAPALRAPGLPPELVGELAVLEASVARFRGDTPRALELSRRALDLLAGEQPELRGGALLNLGAAHHQRGEPEAAARALDEAGGLGEAGGWGRYVALAALEELATLQIRLGRLTAAARSCQRAAKLASRSGQEAMPAAGLAQVALGEVLCERDDLDGAARALAQGMGLLPAAGEPAVLARGYAAQARVDRARGDAEGALVTLRRGEAWLAQQRFPRLGAVERLAAYRARVWIGRGELAAAAAWARECVVAGESELGYLQQLTLVRLRLARARLGPAGPSLREALATLEELLAAAEAVGWTGHVIEILLLQALARQIQGDQARAAQALGQALALAAPEGYVRLFLDEGEPAAALLAGWLAGQREPGGDAPEQATHAHARRLLAAASPSPPAAAMAGALLDPLSGRELAVLRLIAAGRANPEIGAELFVAVSTVKWYVNSLFGKLAVTSRTQAVARARDLGLLTDEPAAPRR